MALVAAPVTAPDTAPTATPLYQTLLDWLTTHLAAPAYSRPFGKRLALLLAGLLVGEHATLSRVAAQMQALALSPAQEPSILRRCARLLADPRLDPTRLLPDVLRALLPGALAPLLDAHAGAPTAAARRPWLRLVVDETTVADRLHVLVLGWAVPGVVLPLALRCWPQNVPQPDGHYWAALSSACWSVQALLPPAVRSRVLLLADRAYGVPQLLDLCGQLGWDYAIRAQGQIRVQLGQQAARPLQTLVPRPGTAWYGGTTLRALGGTIVAPHPATAAAADAADGAGSTLVFKKAGWRRCAVAAAWAVGQREPWLVLTSLAAEPAVLEEYARRWAIERLFLGWKSHGWDLEASGLRDLGRLERLVGVLVLATWWRLAIALPHVQAEAAALVSRAARRAAVLQPWLPGLEPPPRRPRLAQRSLLSWGAWVLQQHDARRGTPALQWAVPPWTAPTWTAHCATLAAALPT